MREFDFRIAVPYDVEYPMVLWEREKTDGGRYLEYSVCYIIIKWNEEFRLSRNENFEKGDDYGEKEVTIVAPNRFFEEHFQVYPTWTGIK